jgi:HEPN domain-containing protein
VANRDFDKDLIIKYWVDSSDEDFVTMNALFDSNRFSWSLFVGHLMIEKLLKALYVKANNDFPPLIHNLLRLSEMCNLQLSEEQRLFFVTVTAFNINTKYDDYKMTFQKTCTPDFSEKWILCLTNQRLWIKKLIGQ